MPEGPESDSYEGPVGRSAPSVRSPHHLAAECIEKNVIKLHDGDLSDSSGLIRLVGEIRPDEIYNLAAQSHVQVSFDAPEYSGDVDALGVLRVLEAVRVCGLTKTCKVYQASTSELYGKVEEVPQKETTPFHPYSCLLYTSPSPRDTR